MQGLYYNGKAGIFREDLPIPQPSANESLVRISLAAICNTDREIMRGYKPNFRGVLGHEFVGIVEKSSEPELVGRRVVGELNEGCGECIYCKTGREKHCESRKCIGIEGRRRLFCTVYDHCNSPSAHIPDSLPDEQAVFTEPLAAP